jgi:carboxyl-terminal processing protease
LRQDSVVEDQIKFVAGVAYQIQRDYVRAVEDDQLVKACKARLSKKFGQLTNDVGQAANLPLYRRLRALMIEAASMHQQGAVPRAIAGECIRGMVSSLDTESSYIDNEEPKVHQGVAGIGVQVHSGGRIVRTVKDSPAEREGIRSGDRLVHIDDEIVDGLPIDAIYKLLKGDLGSKVTIGIERPGEAEPTRFKMTRRHIYEDSVKVRIVEPGVLYVAITRVDNATIGELGQKVRTALKGTESDLRMIVLDLRDNSGGLLHVNVGVVAAFVRGGALVFSSEGRTKDARMRSYASPEYYLRKDEKLDPLEVLPEFVKKAPLAVLVNGSTAAGAELVAAALRQREQTYVVGSKTLGVNELRTVSPLGDGRYITMATAYWLTPQGVNIAGKGVDLDLHVSEATDDFEARASVGTDRDTMLKQAIVFVQEQTQASGRSDGRIN